MPSKLKEYLKLCRIQAIGAVAIVPIMGAMSIIRPSWSLLLELFVVSAFTYVAAITMNEYMDVDVDRMAKPLHEKPLVSGTIPMHHALIISYSSIAIATALTYVFFRSIFLTVFFVFSSVIGAYYDFFGKKYYCMDFFVSTWAMLFFLYGAMSTGVSITELPTITYIMAIMWFLRLVYSNSVEGGVKDIEHDYKAGAKTIPRLMGVRLTWDRVNYTRSFLAFSHGIEALFILLVLTTLIENASLGIWHIVAVVALLLPFTATHFGIIRRDYNREKMKKNTFLHEAIAYAIMGVLLHPIAGALIIIIFVLPLGWFALWVPIIYGRALPQI